MVSSLAVALLIALGAPADPPAGPAELEPGDARALLDASIRSEEAGQLALAERGYRQVLKLDPGATGIDAAFRLARLEIRGQRAESGYRRLRELVAAHGHAGARAELEKAESDATRRQRQVVTAAEEAFQARKLSEARKLYTQAYDMAPEKPSSAAFIQRRELLPLIARIVDAIDDEYFQKKAQPLERSVQPCKACGAEGGFQQCGHCKGAGFIVREFLALQPSNYQPAGDIEHHL